MIFRFLLVAAITAVLSGGVIAQTIKTRAAAAVRKPTAAAVKKPVTAAKTAPASHLAAAEKGTVEGRTYTNIALGFEITFPDTWLIPGDDFESAMLKRGFDLRLRAPAGLAVQTKAQLTQTLKRVGVLVTAYRSMPGSKENAIMRVSVEDLTATPRVRDAVDYFDLMRSQFAAMKPPAGFKYSETQAEALGAKQFAFIDTSTAAGKKRMYATVRGRRAILFTLSYTDESDLASMRQVLAEGNFAIR